MNKNYWFEKLVILISEKMGLHFTENRLQDLRQTVKILAEEYSYPDTETFIQSLVSSSLNEQQVKILSSRLTVGETYFFREMKSLEAFRDYIIPDLTKNHSGQKRKLKIWSAGCSSGEEPYTLAMLFDQKTPKAWNGDIRIWGTDINLQALEKARRGIYTKWSFRGMPDILRDRYFKSIEQGAYTIKSQFKDMVSFSYLNLATDDYSSVLNIHEMDVIFCRNVMMYFTPQIIQRIIRQFYQYLVEGGWLIVAPSETSTLLSSEFSAVPFEGATLYRKVSPKPTYHKVNTVIPTVSKPFPPSSSPSPSICSPSIKMHKEKPPDISTVESSDPVSKNNMLLYEEALAAYQNRQYDEAVGILQMICSETKEQKNFKEKEIEGSVSALMARILANQGNLTQAIEWCERAINKDKINSDHRFLLAMILMEQGQEKAAIQALKRSLYLNPDSIAASYILGTILLRQNRPDDANRYFKQAILLISNVSKETILTELDGMTAGRLRETIQRLMIEGGIKC